MCMTLSVVLMSILSWAIIPMKWSLSLGFITYTPWRLNIMCIGCISLVAFFILGCLPESPKFLLSLGKEQEAIDVLKRIHRTNNKAPTTNAVSYIICLCQRVTGRMFMNSKLFFVCSFNWVYPVMAVERDSVGTDLTDTNLSKVAKLIWNQTWPLFHAPHLNNMLLISYLSSVLYGIAHGMNLW